MKAKKWFGLVLFMLMLVSMVPMVVFAAEKNYPIEVTDTIANVVTADSGEYGSGASKYADGVWKGIWGNAYDNGLHTYNERHYYFQVPLEEGEVLQISTENAVGGIIGYQCQHQCTCKNNHHELDSTEIGNVKKNNPVVFQALHKCKYTMISYEALNENHFEIKAYITENVNVNSITVINGTASKNSALPGDTIALTADPALEGTVFDKWEITGTGVTISNRMNATTTITMGSSDVTATATYKTIVNKIAVTNLSKPVAGAAPDRTATTQTAFRITASSGINWYRVENGTRIRMDNEEKYEAGKTYICYFQILPNAGYIFPTSRTEFAATINGEPARIGEAHSRNISYIEKEYTIPAATTPGTGGTTTTPGTGSTTTTPGTGSTTTTPGTDSSTNQGALVEDKVVKTENVKVSKVSYTVTTTASGVVAAEYKAPAKKTATSATIPDKIKVNGKTVKVTSIAPNAFKKNTKLKKVVIGKNVQKIGANAFSGCSKLATVTFKAKKVLTTIDAKAFYGCKALTKITVPNSVTVIGNQAFANCTKLKTVSLGKNLTTIGNSAFSNCSALAKITIPSKVEKIGKQAFNKCKKLMSITVKTTKLTSETVGKNAFSGIYSKPTVSVPKSKLKSYKSMLKTKGMPKKAKIK